MEIEVKKPSCTVKPLQCQKVTSDVMVLIVHANNLMAGHAQTTSTLAATQTVMVMSDRTRHHDRD